MSGVAYSHSLYSLKRQSFIYIYVKVKEKNPNLSRMQKVIPLPHKRPSIRNKDSDYFSIYSLLLRAHMPHTHTHIEGEPMRKREKMGFFHQSFFLVMSGEPLTKNPHETLCGEGIGFPLLPPNCQTLC